MKLYCLFFYRFVLPKIIVTTRKGHKNRAGPVAISYMAAESGHQITESRNCIFRDPHSASRNP
jgi:hypothetical protein